MGAPLSADALGIPLTLLLLRVGNVSAYGEDAAGLRIARPLWIDVVDPSTGAVVQSLPLPTRRSGAHAACTTSIARLDMLPRFAPGSIALQFVALPCFDAEAGVDMIPDSYFAPRGYSGAWVHPRRVIANVRYDGTVDSRTMLSADACGAAVPTSSVLLNSGIFVVSTHQFADAPHSAYARCGLRAVTVGSTGADEISMTANPPTEDVGFVFEFFQ